MKIFDCFSFHDELDLLEIRLKHLWNEVDYFILVEGDRTYDGEIKPSFYLQNQERFAWAASKIIHLQESLEERPSCKWKNEDILRQAYTRGIKKAEADDIVALSCIEDLFSVRVLQELKNGEVSLPALVVLDSYRYFLNGKVLGPMSYWPYPVFAKYSQIETNINDFWEKRFSFRAIRNGGWHFSELGESNEFDALFSLTELNRVKYVKVDDSFPAYLAQHPDRFKHLLSPVTPQDPEQTLQDFKKDAEAISRSNEVYFFRQLELNRTVSRLEVSLAFSNQIIESERKAFHHLRSDADRMIRDIGILHQKVTEFENSRLIKAKNWFRGLKGKLVPSR